MWIVLIGRRWPVFLGLEIGLNLIVLSGSSPFAPQHPSSSCIISSVLFAFRLAAASFKRGERRPYCLLGRRTHGF